jgi:FkbM family methyltransferase
MDIKIRLLQRVKGYLERYNYLDSFINKYAKNHDFFFVQIGANDGIHADPIHNFIKKYKWKGILIEPQKIYFDKLIENYKDMPQLIFENIAIGLKNEKLELFKVAETEQENWHNLVASLDNSRGDLAWLKNEKHIETETVQVITLPELVQKYSIKKIDLLQIDIEGLEHKILNSDGFFDVKAKIIHYEHKHLTYAEQYDCVSLLQKYNYKVYMEKFDSTAILM